MPKRTFLMKWVFPYALCALVVLWQWHEEAAAPDRHYVLLAIVSVALFAILFFVIRRQGETLPDEVVDGGTFLLVTFGKKVVTVQLSNVADVQVYTLFRLTRLTLHLREPSEVGQTIVFNPFPNKNSSGENLVAVSLRARVNSRAHVA